MKLKIKNNIEESFDDGQGSQILLNSYFEGYNGNDFDVSNIEVKNFRLSPTNTFNENIFDKLSGDMEKCTFLHIFANTIILSPLDIPELIRFRVISTEEGSDSSGTGIPVFLGDLSEFRISNLKKFNNSIRISDVVVPTGKVANLTIIAGFSE